MVESARRHPDQDRLARISSREAEVLHWMSLGLTNSQIAEHLNVTVHAVKFHLASIYRKFGVTNRTEAAVMYLQSPQPLDDSLGGAGLDP